MYPRQDLIRLAVHKAALRRSIARHRAECAAAAALAVEPIEWLDRILATWRRMAPFAPLLAVPLGFLATRTSFPRTLRWVLRWAPLVVGSFQGIRTFVSRRAGRQARDFTPGAATRRS